MKTARYTHVLALTLLLSPSFSNGDSSTNTTAKSSSYGNSVLSRDDLDPVALRENALDTLLNEKLQKVVTSVGVAPGEFESSVVVNVIETTPPKAVDRKPAATPKKDEANQDLPPLETFNDSSLFSADHLMKKYREDLKREEEEAADRVEKGPVAGAALAKEYVVNHVYMHVSVGDKVQKEVADQVDSVIKNAFGPVFGSRFSFDVQKGVEMKPSMLNWIKMGMDWAAKLQPLAITLVLALLGSLLAMALLWTWKLIPSWQKNWVKKTAHDHNYNKNHRYEEELKAAPVVEKEEPEEEVEEEPEVPAGPPPIAPEVLAARAAQEEELRNRKRIARLKKQILSFATGKPQVIERVLQDWSNRADDPSKFLKINLTLELLVSNGIPIGKVELRNELLLELRRTKKSSLELGIKDKLEIFDSIYWDCISAQHLSQEGQPKSLAFFDQAEDRAVLEVLREENSQVQAMILVSIDEKRAAKILSMLPSKERKTTFSHLFGAEAALSKLSMEEIGKLAERLSVRLTTINQEHSALGSMRGIENFIPILRSMDFETQFVAARGFISLESKTRNNILSSYFNIGMLPAAKADFLRSVFLDRPSEWILRVTSQFEAGLMTKILDILPPFQKRMLEGANYDSINKGEAMEALSQLNSEINERIDQGKLVMSDIFDLANENDNEHDLNGGTGNNDKNKAA
jgi:flagellar motor switch protein FliG